MKNKIIAFLKLFTIVFSMIQGFFFTMAYVWIKCGLPLNGWSIVLLYVLAFVFEGIILMTWVDIEED